MTGLTELRGKVYSGVTWSVAQAWGAHAINLAVVAVLARLLAPEMFGLLALATVFTSLVKSNLDQGLSTAIVQRSDLDDQHLDAVFWISVFVGTICTIGGFLAADLIAGLFKEPDLAPVIRWLSIVFVIDAFATVQQAILRRQMAFRLIAVRSLWAVAVGGAAGIAMAVRDAGVMSLVVQQVTTSVVGVLVLWSVSEWRPHFRFSLAHAKSLVGFGYNIMGIRLLTFASRRSDDLFIGYFLGSIALGYYSIAYKLYKVLLDVLAAVVSRVALPAFAKLQADREKFRGALRTAVSTVAVIAFPTFVGIGLIAPELVAVVFGSEWTRVAPVIRALAVGGVAQCIVLIFQQAFIAFGRPQLVVRLMSVTTLLLIVGFAVSAQFGITAIAIAFAIVSCVSIPLQIGMLKGMIGYGYREFVPSIIPGVAGVLVMVPTVMLWREFGKHAPPLVRVVVGIALGATAYAALLIWRFPETRRFMQRGLLERFRRVI